MASTSNDIVLRRLSAPEDGSSVTSVELRPITRKKQILVLNSGFLTICLVVGINQAYGVFQGYYTSKSQTLLPPSAHNSGALLAFVGTLGAGLTWGGSIFVNPILSRVEGKSALHLAGRQWITLTGVLLMSLAFLLASFATQIWHLLLTQGLLYGIGSSMLYFPILSTAPEYFTSHRGSALGFILSGTGVGGLAMSPAIQSLLTHVGPRNTLRVLALLTLILLPIALTAAPTRFTHRRPTHISLPIARSGIFLFSAAAALLSAAGNLLPAIFLPQFSVAIGYSPSFAAILLALANAVSCCSQTFVGFLGDRVGRQNTLLLMISLSTVGTLGLWLTSIEMRRREVWLAFVIVFGVAGGGFNALFPTMVGEVFGMRDFAAVNGFMYFMRGVGAVLGSPVGGSILGDGGGVEGWWGVVWFDGALLLGACACAGVVRVLSQKEGWVWKA